MSILVRKNIRIISSFELIGPALAVERIDLIQYHSKMGGPVIEFELFCLEDGTRKRADELIFLEVDEGLLVSMRLEARILAENKGKHD